MAGFRVFAVEVPEKVQNAQGVLRSATAAIEALRGLVGAIEDEGDRAKLEEAAAVIVEAVNRDLGRAFAGAGPAPAVSTLERADVLRTMKGVGDIQDALARLLGRTVKSVYGKDTEGSKYGRLLSLEVGAPHAPKGGG